jgi:predicted phage-related endonuclease
MIEIRQIKSGPEGREEWLDWRRGALTASDIGAVEGVDPYKTPLRVYAEKTTGGEDVDNAQMRRGRLFEIAAVDYLREAHPTWRIERPAAFYVDVDVGLGCTPDAFAWDEDGRLINCQIKVISAPVFERWDGKPPKSYMYQTACENLLTQADAGILAVLVISTFDAELVEFDVPRHQGAERRFYDIAREFWTNIRNGVVPAPNYEKDSELITALYPPSPEVPAPLDLAADNRIGQVLEERDNLKGLIKEAEGQVKALDAEIVDKLQGAERANAAGWKISYTITHRKEFTVPAKDFPSLRVTRVAEEPRP